jgi:hypothetical protein
MAQNSFYVTEDFIECLKCITTKNYKVELLAGFRTKGESSISK